MFGFLNINKPTGVTSRYVTTNIQQLFPKDKVGHAGTLDPLATGVLVIAIGPATRLIPYLARKPKSYIGRFRMGFTSDTQDIEGDVTPVENSVPVSRQQIESVLPRFVGLIKQVPPKFSAIKVDGKRAYRLARQGREFSIQEKEVEIFSLGLRKFDFPEFEIELRCSSGTYVRTLGRDIARACNSDAIMTSLRRTQVGIFDNANSTELDQLTDKSVAKQRFESPTVLLRDFSKREITEEQALDLFHGSYLHLDSRSDEVVVIHRGRLIAIVSKVEEGLFKPQTNFIHYWIRMGVYDFGENIQTPKMPRVQ